MSNGKNLPTLITGLQEGDAIASIKKTNISRHEKKVSFFDVETDKEHIENGR